MRWEVPVGAVEAIVIPGMIPDMKIKTKGSQE